MLTVNRVPFNAVPGLTINQRSAGTGIEHVYSTGLTGPPFANLVLDRVHPDGGDLPGHPGPVGRRAIRRTICSRLGRRPTTSIGSSPRRSTARTTSRSTRRARPRTAAIHTRARCGAASPGTWGDHNGDIEAPKYDTNGWALYFGGDYSFTQNWLLGGAIGYVQSDLTAPNTPGHEGPAGNAAIDTTGWQGAIYTSYEMPQNFYVRGIGSYASYNGNAHREINIPALLGGFATASTRIPPAWNTPTSVRTSGRCTAKSVARSISGDMSTVDAVRRVWAMSTLI